MLENYFKTALRNLLHQKSNTVINIAGLTLGITCSLVLYLIVSYHNSFDTHHTKKDRIYRVVTESEGNHGKDYQPGVPTVLPDAFRLDFPEAEEVAFTTYRSDALVTIPQPNGPAKKFQEEEGVVFTEPSFLKIFDWEIVYGDGLKSLDEPNEAILSEQWAIRYFGKADAIGEVVKFNDQEFRVGAIMKDPPHNTDFPFQLMLSYVTIEKEREAQGWNSIWSDEQCYFLLKENHTIQALQERLPAFTKKHLGEDDFDRSEFLVQSLVDLHFDDRFDTYSYNTVPRMMLYVFGVIAAILIITACINFINLSTAEAIKRSKEIGIRKTMGSTRSQLVIQFLGETTFVTLLAVLLSLGIAQLLLSFINPFMELHLVLDFTGRIDLWMFIITVTVGVSILSGLYPALVVSGYKPALALKNQVNNKNSSGFRLRKSLVVLQFFISQFFIIGTIVIIQQINFFHQKDLGFTKDGILVLPLPAEREGTAADQRSSKQRTLRQEISNIAGVEQVSLGSSPPSSGHISKTSFSIEGDPKEYLTQIKRVDGNYVPLYNLKLFAGQNIADLDTINGFIVNEEFARVTGFQSPEDLLGKQLTVSKKTFPIVGIVRDFHTHSLQNPIEPTVLFNSNNNYNTIAIKVNLKHMPALVDQVKDVWELAYPEELFAYEFLDDSIRQFYEGERKMALLISIFTSIAIFIGCLGLFGLASFMTNQKTKEIGVRKVLGASVQGIVMMFSQAYAKLILIGFVLAAPLAGFAMRQFLNEFEYKIDIGWGIYLLALIVTILIATITVGYKSLSAAVANPVKSLRYE